MQDVNHSQSGQALILIALAMIGVMGLIALAIDGGNTFADRRQAQDAADAASLAASMRFAQDQSLSMTYFNDLVIARTSVNGYTNTLPRDKVVLTTLPTANGDCPNNASGLFFQVDIDSNLTTYFANVVGISQIHNHVTSRSLGCPPVYEPAFGGHAIVALNKHVCEALKISGTSQTIVTSSTGQGLFVNSDCTNDPTNPQNALVSASGSVIAPSVNVVGGIYHPEDFLPPTPVTTGVARARETYLWPDITAADCGGTATVMAGHPDTLNPGVFPGANMSWKTKDFPPSGITKLNPGLYCLDNDFKTTGGSALTGSEVMFYQRNGIVSIQGGDNTLSARTTGAYRGLLFYMPISNTSGSITINGGSSSTYFGSIVAPGAHVTLNGGGDTSGPIHTQVIADTISLGGNGTLQLFYDADQQYMPPISAGIQLVK
jgi:Flp pilus assembly protein TadG